MMKIYLILFLMVAVACAPTHEHKLQISGFESQVYAFEAAGGSVGVPIYIDDLVIVETPNLSSGGTEDDGICHPGNATNTPEIEVRKEYWDSASDVSKEVLLFHELGHCILYRLAPNNGHISTENSDHMPVSIMYPIDIWGSYGAQQYYTTNRQVYIHELFNF